MDSATLTTGSGQEVRKKFVDFFLSFVIFVASFENIADGDL